MKFINRILFSVLAAAAFGTALLAPAPCRAQNVGLYQPVASSALTNSVLWGSTTNQFSSGSVTNSFGLPGTTTNLVQAVNDYDYVGLTWSFYSGANSSNSLSIYKSFDNGANFEATPSFSYYPVSLGAGAYVTNTILDIHGVTTLGIVAKNFGATASTNNLIEFNLKASRIQTQQAGVGNGKSPGTPIVVPNGAN